jgi:hypothetical protein
MWRCVGAYVRAYVRVCICAPVHVHFHFRVRVLVRVRVLMCTCVRVFVCLRVSVIQTAGPKAARWAKRVLEQKQTPALTGGGSACAPAAPAQLGGLGSKAARWVERALAKASKSGEMAPSAAGAAGDAHGAGGLQTAETAAVSKAARWAARVGAGACGALEGARAQTSSTICAKQLVQGHMQALPYPAIEVAASGSAMEAWLARAARKEQHLDDGAAHRKLRDYVDERHRVKHGGLTEQQVVRERVHWNPPELSRKYSSIKKRPDCAQVAGLGWARSCLDSAASWQPSSSLITEWMEIDAGEEMELLGLVTQAQAANANQGQSQEGEVSVVAGGAFVTRLAVKYRRHATQPWASLACDLSVGRGGQERRETLFPEPVCARFVRLFPIDFHGEVALRAGLLLAEHPDSARFDLSPFALASPPSLPVISHAPPDAVRACETAGLSQERPGPGRSAENSGTKRNADSGPGQLLPSSSSCLVPVLPSSAPPQSADAAAPAAETQKRRIWRSETGVALLAASPSREGANGEEERRSPPHGGWNCLWLDMQKTIKEKLSTNVVPASLSSPLALPLSVRWKTAAEVRREFAASHPLSVAALTQLAPASVKVPVLHSSPATPSASGEGSLGGATLDAGLHIQCGPVWHVKGELPFVVCLALPSGDYPLVLQTQQQETHFEVMVCSKIGGAYSLHAESSLFAGSPKEIGLTVSMDARGFHVAVAPHTEACLFYAHCVGVEALGVKALAALNLFEFIAPNSGRDATVEISRLPLAQGIWCKRTALPYKYKADDWTLVFRQTAPMTFGDDLDLARMLLVDGAFGETADNYSKLAALEEMRCSDGHFSFLLSYPSIPGKRNIWRSESARPAPHTACGLAAERQRSGSGAAARSMRCASMGTLCAACVCVHAVRLGHALCCVTLRAVCTLCVLQDPATPRLCFQRHVRVQGWTAGLPRVNGMHLWYLCLQTIVQPGPDERAGRGALSRRARRLLRGAVGRAPED